MAATETEIVQGIGSDYEIKYRFHADENYFFKSTVRPSHELGRTIRLQEQPAWMRKFRHKSLDYFRAADADVVDRPERHRLREHLLLHPPDREAGVVVEDLLSEIKDTWDKLGIPEAEKKYLAGVGAQYESEVVYHKLQEDLEKQA